MAITRKKIKDIIKQEEPAVEEKEATEKVLSKTVKVHIEGHNIFNIKSLIEDTDIKTITQIEIKNVDIKPITFGTDVIVEPSKTEILDVKSNYAQLQVYGNGDMIVTITGKA